MNRSSKMISLVLIGSALVLGGFCCIRYGESYPNRTFGTGRYGTGGSRFYYGGSPGSSFVSSGGGGARPGGAVSPGVTRTGGFGGIGHAAAGS